jgi:hypothetical protein
MKDSETSAWVFGYGSLVNRATHDYTRAAPATLPGWRRVWRHTDLRPVAFLSIEPAPEVEIDGLLAEVPGAGWAALDAREAAYHRHPATGLRHGMEPSPEAVVYAVPGWDLPPPDKPHPLLQSYVDVVAQGFLAEYGEAGLGRFFETTVGWDAPVINDRGNPVYPRHQTLEPDEIALVDDWLIRLGVERRAP